MKLKQKNRRKSMEGTREKTKIHISIRNETGTSLQTLQLSQEDMEKTQRALHMYTRQQTKPQMPMQESQGPSKTPTNKLVHQVHRTQDKQHIPIAQQ
jgi:hypothetical protein